VGTHVISTYVFLYLSVSRTSSQFPTAVTVLGGEFWDDISCSAVEIYNLFEGPCCLCSQCRRLGYLGQTGHKETI
jgi:hypothetical protein